MSNASLRSPLCAIVRTPTGRDEGVFGWCLVGLILFPPGRSEVIPLLALVRMLLRCVIVDLVALVLSFGMSRVGLRELRQDASALVRRVEEGESVEITVAGRLAARLVPTTPQRWRKWDDVADLFAGPVGTDFDRDMSLLDHSVSNPWERSDEGSP